MPHEVVRQARPDESSLALIRLSHGSHSPHPLVSVTATILGVRPPPYGRHAERTRRHPGSKLLDQQRVTMFLSLRTRVLSGGKRGFMIGGAVRLRNGRRSGDSDRRLRGSCRRRSPRRGAEERRVDTSCSGAAARARRCGPNLPVGARGGTTSAAVHPGHGRAVRGASLGLIDRESPRTDHLCVKAGGGTDSRRRVVPGPNLEDDVPPNRPRRGSPADRPVGRSSDQSGPWSE